MHSGTLIVNVLMFAALLGLWLFFAFMLEGIDADTFFIALFCTIFSMFCIKALCSGMVGPRGA
jgi:hypothetical protein